MRTKERTSTRTARTPPYTVFLHNDDVNEMDYVVSALCKSVPDLSSVEARVIMREAHHSGVAAVVTCPLEKAEFYRDRLRTYLLSVSIERG